MGLVDSIRDGIGSRSNQPPYKLPAQPAQPPPPTTQPSTQTAAVSDREWVVDLERRHDQLTARVAELQWDLGGLVYEMAIRDRVRVDVLIKKAAALQDVDAELGEVERILRLEKTGVAGTCTSCDAPHSGGAVYCWQCGNGLLEQVPSEAIGR
jgi:hypothetical protein